MVIGRLEGVVIFLVMITLFWALLSMAIFSARNATHTLSISQKTRVEGLRFIRWIIFWGCVAGMIAHLIEPQFKLAVAVALIVTTGLGLSKMSQMSSKDHG